MNQAENNQKKFTINPESGAVETASDNQAAPIFEENGTFCRVGSTTGGILEVDLISERRRGAEDRCISFKVVGFDEKNNILESEMFFLNEEHFKKLKEFIIKLNWND